MAYLAILELIKMQVSSLANNNIQARGELVDRQYQQQVILSLYFDG